MNELALFAGAGGGLLGTRLLGWRSVCYVEKDPYCIRVLKARIKDGYLDDAPIWDYVWTFDGRPWAGLVDIITAGFPCQPFSGAGLQLGEQDERNLWPDTIRIIREIRPEWVLLENVSRLLSNAYIRRIFADLAESRYDARWDCIPACAVGAPHQRDRVWIVGHAQSARDWSLSVRSRRQGQADSIDAYRTGQNVSDTDMGGLQESKDEREIETALPVRPNTDRCDSITWWNVEPDVGRVANGVDHRVERLGAIGNGQVPAVVRAAWTLLATEDN